MNGRAWHTVKTLSAQILFAIPIIGKSIKQPTAMLIIASWIKTKRIPACFKTITYMMRSK